MFLDIIMNGRDLKEFFFHSFVLSFVALVLFVNGFLIKIFKLYSIYIYLYTLRKFIYMCTHVHMYISMYVCILRNMKQLWCK